MLKSFAKSFLLYGLASGLSRSMLVLIVPVYTAVFTPNEYGIVDLLSGFSALVIILCMLQLESGIARYYYETKAEDLPKLVSTGFWTILFFTVIFCLSLYFLSSIVANRILEQNSVTDLIRLVALLVPVSVVFNFLVFLIRYEGKPLIYFGFIMTQVLVSLGAIIWFIYYNDFGVRGVLYGQVLGMVVPLPFLIFYFRGYVSFQWEVGTMKMLLGYSLPLLPSVAINWGNAYLSRFLMLNYLTLSEIGIYSLAVRIATAFSMIEMAFTLTWSPFFWDTFSKKTSFTLYRTIFRLTTVTILVLVIAATLFSREVVAIFANENYANTVGILGIVFLAYSTTIFIQMVGMGPAIVKKTWYNALIVGGGLLFNMIVLYALIGTAGLSGMALALLLGNLFTLGVQWTVSEKLYPIGYPAYFFIGIFVLTMCIVGMCYFFPLPLLLRAGVAVAILTLGGTYILSNISKVKYARWETDDSSN